MSLPVPTSDSKPIIDSDEKNSDEKDPISIVQLTDPERYTKLTFDNMMKLTKKKGENPPHVIVFRLISATDKIFKQRIVYQGENGKQVFTWDDEDLNIKDDAKGTGRTRAHIDKMTGQSGFYIRKSQMPSVVEDVVEDVIEAPNAPTEAVAPPPKKKGMFGRMFGRSKDVPAAVTEAVAPDTEAVDPPPKKKGMFGRMFGRSKGGSVRKTRRRKTKRRKTKRRKTKRRKTKRRKTRRKR